VSRFWVYIVRCSDSTLYTGFTKDVEKRLARHNAGRGSKYTRARLPVRLAYLETAGTAGEALRREVEVKRMSRLEKLRLCSSYAGRQSVR
jgi:putative endonuclease